MITDHCTAAPLPDAPGRPGGSPDTHSRPTYPVAMDNQNMMIARLAAAGVGIYGLASANMAVVAGAVFVGATLMLVDMRTKSRAQSVDDADVDRMEALSDAEFDRQLRDYEQGRRDTLPGQ